MSRGRRAEATAVIEAGAERVYAVIADYRHGHPRIAPKPYFSDLEVELGGDGEGTVVRFRMRLLGTTRLFRAAITEPQPGRVLVETDVASGIPTTFTVTPLGEGRSRVTISTNLSARNGLFNRLEAFMASRILPGIYAEELRLLGQVARERARKTA